MNRNSLPFDLITPMPQNHRDHNPEAKQHLLAERQLPAFLTNHEESARRYKPSQHLLQAINMTLHTGCPLLLTGDPGTGKTQAADFIGAYFGIPVYKFLVKSTSLAQDLLYEFDAVGYLHWAQSAQQSPTTPENHDQESSDPKPETAAEADAVREGFLKKRPLWQAYDHPGDSVVLIDEIDKASRDYPNDLLYELDRHCFPHPFKQEIFIRPKSGRPPIVIITSNAERRLPDAFLRRCIFHRIELTKELLRDAVESRAIAQEGNPGFPNLDEVTREVARKRFWEILEDTQVEKKPSTAELLTWLCILSAQGVSAHRIKNCQLAELPGIGALIKDAEDLKRLQ